MSTLKVLLAALVVGLETNQAGALSADASFLARGRVFEALASPSGKLTISPEVVIPESSDPTAILLQANSVNILSERIRVCKANSAWVSGGENAVKIFCTEQENSRGSFPGPIPVIYCGSEELEPELLAEAGASGAVIPLFDGNELESLDQISADNDWVSKSASFKDSGVIPIPEVTIGDAMAKDMQEGDVEKLVEALASATGEDPVAVLLTMNPADDEQEQAAVPKVPRSLGKRIPILGSVRVTAGENRLGIESQRFKEAGLTGVVLRSDCVPGFRLNPDLEIVGQFWSACVGDLKSTRSKKFQFNSRNNMEKSGAVEWAKYQSNVIESGALGDMNDSYSVVDEAAGEYKGFA